MAQSNGGQKRTAAGLQRSQQFQSNSSLSSIRSLKAPSVLSKQSLETTTRHTKRVTFSQKTPRDAEQNTELAACLTTSQADVRLSAGENDPAQRKVTGLPRTNSECPVKPPGMGFLTGATPKLAEFEIKIDTKGCPKRHVQQMCQYFDAYEDRGRFKHQGTQSMYRESSAQTLAYLPEIADKAQAEHLELFTLPNLLDGNKPPGLYEVEILERTRKRVAFTAAVKTNLKQQLQEKRELAMQTKYRAIFKAFEWERWIEREEHIQQCQMARLEIVIKMFDRREREMHEASRRRIEAACQRIEERRLKGLRKNELVYQRGMRRLKAQCEKKTLHWIKETPVRALGSRCSEHYAPLLRHGVDPARQHFAKDRKQQEFDMHIEELDKRIKMGNLVCPFAKLNYWSKPKPPQQEYEQNFCTDKNLQKLYESLVRLREESEIPKTNPKCLKKRKRAAQKTIVEPVDESFSSTTQSLESAEKSAVEQSQGELSMQSQPLNTDNIAKELLQDRRQFDIENTMHMHEGSCIGNILQFLNDEMERLEEQRRLHYIVIMAQQERWRREAAEAGLRQKENEIRHIYDELFQEGSLVNETEEYVKDILTTDVAHIAEEQALEAVLEMARKVDIDVQRWQESFKLIQTPLTYHTLRNALRKMVCPNFEELVLLYEKKVIADYIIEDVLFENIWQALEPFDISSTLTSDLLDRLIDNDLYLFSTDSEDDDDSRKSSKEARAIIRKLIRQAVPGRRWKTDIERIAHENYLDLLDDVFNEIFMSTSLAELAPCEPNSIHSVQECRILPSNYKLLAQKSSIAETRYSSVSVVIKQQLLNIIKKIRKDKITGDLKSTDMKFVEDEMFKDTDRDTLLDIQTFREPSGILYQRPTVVIGIQSTINLKNEPDFKSMKLRAVKIKIPQDGILSLAEEDVNLNEEEEFNVEGMAYEADDEQSVKDNLAPRDVENGERADSYVSGAKFSIEVPEKINEMILKVAVERKHAMEDQEPTRTILRKSVLGDNADNQSGKQNEQKVKVTDVTKEQVIEDEAEADTARQRTSVSLLGSAGSVTHKQLVNDASSYFDKKLSAIKTEDQDDEHDVGNILNIAPSAIDLPVLLNDDASIMVDNKAKRE